MTEFATSVAPQVQVRPMSTAFAGAAIVQHELPVDERDQLACYFRTPLGYAWRANFVEPALDDVRGLGPALLPFDF
jgi:hypothetical protein